MYTSGTCALAFGVLVCAKRHRNHGPARHLDRRRPRRRGGPIRFFRPHVLQRGRDARRQRPSSPSVLGDSPLLRAGKRARPLQGGRHRCSSAPQSGTALEVVDMRVHRRAAAVDVAPGKGNLLPQRGPGDRAVCPGSAAVYAQSTRFYPRPARGLAHPPFVQRGLRGQAVWGTPVPVQPRDRACSAPIQVDHRARGTETEAAPVNPAVADRAHVALDRQGLTWHGRFLNGAALLTDRYDYIEEHGKVVVVTDAMYDDVLAPLIAVEAREGPRDRGGLRRGLRQRL